MDIINQILCAIDWESILTIGIPAVVVVAGWFFVRDPTLSRSETRVTWSIAMIAMPSRTGILLLTVPERSRVG